MGELKVCVPDDVENRFRRAAMERFGYSKGSLSEAAKEALDLWSENDKRFQKEAEEINDPIEEIKGMLRHVKKNSVELQHEIEEIWGAKRARPRR